jgi:diguanylate cyclase (GGDEF)-like protein
LQIFAADATATLGADVLFGRIGGEEFAAFLPVGDLDEAFAIADRVRRKFAAAAAHLGDQELVPSVSIGVTLGRDPEADVDALLAVADQALYRAKSLGRNRVETIAPAATAREKMPAGTRPIVSRLKADRADAAA